MISAKDKAISKLETLQSLTEDKTMKELINILLPFIKQSETEKKEKKSLGFVGGEK